jgi:hypothetical protein
MATTLSNLYVERAASEHPLALWSLNEPADYISLVTEEERKLYLFNEWQVVEGEITPFPGTSLLNTPFLDSETVKFEGDPPDDPTGTFFAKGKFDIQPRLADGFGSFAISFFAYIDSGLINSVSFGYVYVDEENNEQEVLSTVTVRSSYVDNWTQFLDTFDMPPAGAENIRLILKFNSKIGGGEGAYDVYINGLSAGHWAEDFMSKSFGVVPISMPNNIALPSILNVTPAFPYGSSGDLAYYISNENKLRCKNFGVPLVYGSSEVTKIYPNSLNGTAQPSLIFPGYGFLNQRGKTNDYTVEMWVRINSASPSTKKIFGPIASEDGLYVDDSFITLRIGKSYGSHFIGEWYRPMLVHIRIVQNSAVVVINGEEVINFDVDEDLNNLPLEILQGKSQDWLGFYAYDDIPLIDLDSFSIYSYGIPTQVAKRRFVWGQAVSAPEQTNSAVNAVTAFNDYSFANYASNYNYPDFANWRQAFFSNIDADSRALKLPQYQLPTFSLVDRNVQDLFNELQDIQPTSDPDDVLNRKYFTLETGNSSQEYIYFEDLNVLNDRLSTIYGVFKTDGIAVNQPLIKITNKISKDNILILLDGTTVTYSSDINNVKTVLATKTIEANKKFTVGLNLEFLSVRQILGLKAFFTDTSFLDMYVAGDGTSKFTGKIYKVGFDAGYNNRNIEQYYDPEGIFLEDDETAESMYKHTANYTLVAIDKYGVFFADIAVAGYWEDYMPLSYFAKYVLDNDGKRRYDLDFLQFNIDFPEPNALNIVEETREWYYSDLNARFRSPQVLFYRDLNNKFFTKWDNYEDMSEDSVKTIFFNTEKSTVRSYISFQQLSDGANKNLVDFEEIAKPLANEVVDPDGRSFDWQDTAYEITTGSIIYPPKTVRRIINNIERERPISFENLAIVYHVEFKSEGILHQPIKIKELQLASQVFERTRLTPVGSKFGVPVFYYSKPGFYFDLKGKNPIATYKKSTPHLYLNRQSGWKLRGDFDLNTDRGLAMPINQSAALATEVSSVQLWVRFSEREFPGERVKIFSISHNDGVFDFYVQGDNSLLRGEIFGIDKQTGQPLENLNYFINGRKMVKPYIVKEEWSVVSVEFPNLLNFSGRSGFFNLNGPLTYNNVSYNLSTNLEKNESIEARLWNELLSVRRANVVTAVSADGETTYTTNKKFEIGQKVTISGASPSEYNTAPGAPATIIDVDHGPTTSTFTIEKTVSVAFLAGGVAQASAWEYAETDLVVTDNSLSPFTWKQVRVLSQSRSFNINPETIYSKYTGSDRIIIDDETNGLLVQPEQFTLYSEVVWRESTKIPV